jgi:hypothetical protein
MAVFTLDDFMGRGAELLIRVWMTVFTIIPPLIFHFESFPVFLAGFSVPAIHVVAPMDSEIFGHH